jgi:hypothetical protein
VRWLKILNIPRSQNRESSTISGQGLGHPHRSAGEVVENRATRPKLFIFYDLSDMEKRILFGFYHLAKNRGGRGYQARPAPCSLRLGSLAAPTGARGCRALIMAASPFTGSFPLSLLLLCAGGELFSATTFRLRSRQALRWGGRDWPLRLRSEQAVQADADDAVRGFAWG